MKASSWKSHCFSCRILFFRVRVRVPYLLSRWHLFTFGTINPLAASEIWSLHHLVPSTITMQKQMPHSQQDQWWPILVWAAWASRWLHTPWCLGTHSNMCRLSTWPFNSCTVQKSSELGKLFKVHDGRQHKEQGWSELTNKTLNWQLEVYWKRRNYNRHKHTMRIP